MHTEPTMRATSDESEALSKAAPAPRPLLAWALRQSLIGVLLLGVLVGGGAWLTYNGIDVEQDARAALAAAPRVAIGDVKSWGYQLQATDAAQVAASAHDLLVVDAELGGDKSPEHIERALIGMRARAGRPSRLLLAYLSIGEAEDYRSYWRRRWVQPAAVASGLPATGQTGAVARAPIPRPAMAPSAEAPAWLGRENPEWPRNYLVRYWDAGWQAYLLGNPEAALDRIIAAGFDGIYLDRADAFTDWRDERPEAGQDMVALITRLAAYARERRPGFLVTLQNAEELLEHTVLRETIDAVAKEDLLYGAEKAEMPNGETEVGHSLKYLDKARRDGRPVLVVEYLTDKAKIRAARERLATFGYIAYIGPRALNRLGRD